MGADCVALYVQSSAPGRSWCDFKNVIFNLALLIGIFKCSYDNVLRWIPQDLTDDKSTLVQVMAWCRQATSHYLNQSWPRSPMPYHASLGPNELKHGPIYHDITYSTVTIVAESESDFRITTDTPYLALMGKLWRFIVSILKKIQCNIVALCCTIMLF